jgi:hypothetical protein
LVGERRASAAGCCPRYLPVSRPPANGDHTIRAVSWVRAAGTRSRRADPVRGRRSARLQAGRVRGRGRTTTCSPAASRRRPRSRHSGSCRRLRGRREPATFHRSRSG